MLRLKRKSLLYLRDLSDIPYPVYGIMVTILLVAILVTKYEII
jgi:hypothetical protein